MTAVAFISQKLRTDFESLKCGKYEDRELYEFINRAIDDLKESSTCGTRIPKEYWPKEYVRRYKITNLWKYDLPNAWRLIYIIADDEVRIVSVILEWLDHKNYERRFGYG